MTHEGRIINNHDRIFLSKCNLSNKKTLQRHVLTFLTEFASEAIHALALLPRPVVQTGAPMSAGASGAGSFQSWTSTDTTTHKLTIRQSVWQVIHTVGSREVSWKRNSTKKGQMSCDFSPCAAIQKKNPHKEPQRISILKDLSSLFTIETEKKKKIQQLVSLVKNLPIVLKKTSF